MQFYFTRHGQSENNLLYDQTGASVGRSPDPELTAIGRQQAEILARFLRDPQANNYHREGGFGITHLYTSLMVRSLATGMIVAQGLELSLVAWEDLHETGGIFLDDEKTGKRIGQPGKSRGFFEANYQNLVLPSTVSKSGWWNRPFEEREQSTARAERFLRELYKRHGKSEDRVAVISHGGFYNVLLRVLFTIEDEYPWFALNNAGITRMDFGMEEFGVVYMNRMDHIPKELMT